MPQTAKELALLLRAILEKFVTELDQEILEGKTPVDKFGPEFIEGMASVVETAEALSGLVPIPKDVLDEIERQRGEDGL